MDKEQIYQLLDAKNVSARMIADALNVSRPAVSAVIRDGRGSKRIAKAIADICNKPLGEIFPHYEKQQTLQIERERKQQKLNERLAKYA